MNTSSSFFSASSSGSHDKDVYPPKIFPSFVLIIVNVPSILSHLSWKSSASSPWSDALNINLYPTLKFLSESISSLTSPLAIKSKSSTFVIILLLNLWFLFFVFSISLFFFKLFIFSFSILLNALFIFLFISIFLFILLLLSKLKLKLLVLLLELFVSEL